MKTTKLILLVGLYSSFLTGCTSFNYLQKKSTPAPKTKVLFDKDPATQSKNQQLLKEIKARQEQQKSVNQNSSSSRQTSRLPAVPVDQRNPLRASAQPAVAVKPLDPQVRQVTYHAENNNKQSANVRLAQRQPAKDSVKDDVKNPKLEKGKAHIIKSLDLKDAAVVDAVRLISTLSGLNIVATTDAAKVKVTMHVEQVTAISTIETLAKVTGLRYREDPIAGTIRLMTADEYKKLFGNEATQGTSGASENKVIFKDGVIQLIDVQNIKIIDLVRMISKTTDKNIVATEEAGKKQTTLFLRNSSVEAAIRTIAKINGLWFREDAETGTFRLMTTEEYQKDITILDVSKTKVFTLQHPNATSIATAIEDLYGGRVVLNLQPINDDDFVFNSAFGSLGGSSSGLGVSGIGGGTGNQGSISRGTRGGGRGFGSGFGGNALGRGSFSRGGSSNRGGFGGNRGFNNFTQGTNNNQRRENLFPSEGLSPQQAENLEKLANQRLLQSKDEKFNITMDDIRSVTQSQPPIYITYNQQHNLVVVRTSDQQAMKEIDQLVLQLDRPTPQVLLEMKILEITLDDQFRSIFDVDFLTGPTSNGPGGNPILTNTAVAATESILGVGNFALEGGNTLVYQFLNDNIRARIQLMEGENRLNRIATPLLMASNNRPARIFVGEERVLTRGVNTTVVQGGTGTATTAVSPETEIRDIGTSLIIIPKINADRTVTLQITQDRSSVIDSGANIPVPTDNGGVTSFPVDSVNTQQIFGTVVAKDGKTIALGGLITETVIRNHTKVPVLGDLPIIGRLFRREFDQDVKTELILLITPHVITTPSEGEAKSQWRVRANSNHPFVQCAPQGPSPEVIYESTGNHYPETVQPLPLPKPKSK